MLGSSILDVAIGMAFIYLLLSLIASTVQEVLAAAAQSRAANLEHGIRSLFSGSKLDNQFFVDLVYKHGLIRGLYQEPVLDDGKGGGGPHKQVQNPFRDWLRRRLGVRPSQMGVDVTSNPFLLPAYIPSRTFAITLIDILSSAPIDLPPQSKQLSTVQLQAGADVVLPATPQAATDTSEPVPNCAERKTILQTIEDRLTSLRGPTNSSNVAAEALLALISNAKCVPDAKDAAIVFRAEIENWYNDAMDRVSGWYKKHTQQILMVVGLVLAIVFNVDSVRVAQTLWFDHDARQGLASAAGTYVTQNPNLPTSVAGTLPPAGDGTTPPAPKLSDDAYEKALAARMTSTVNAFNEVSAKNLLPVGWRYTRADYRAILDRYRFDNFKNWDFLHPLIHLLGWMTTAIALSLGAPFWFDILNKFMIVRSTVKPQEKSKDEPSKS